MNEAITVEMKPPMAPSQVFLGASWISGVLPNNVPTTYDITSFTTTNKHGNNNLKISEWFFYQDDFLSTILLPNQPFK